MRALPPTGGREGGQLTGTYGALCGGAFRVRVLASRTPTDRCPREEVTPLIARCHTRNTVLDDASQSLSRSKPVLLRFRHSFRGRLLWAPASKKRERGPVMPDGRASAGQTRRVHRDGPSSVRVNKPGSPAQAACPVPTANPSGGRCARLRCGCPRRVSRWPRKDNCVPFLRRETAVWRYPRWPGPRRRVARPDARGH